MPSMEGQHILTVMIPFLICSKEVSRPLENNKGLKLTLSICPGIIDSFNILKHPFNLKFSDFFFISVISAYESCTKMHLLEGSTKAL